MIPGHHRKVSWSNLFQGNEQVFAGMLKVSEDDIAFKLAIFKKSLHLIDNTGFCSIIQASKLVFGSLLAKNNFFCPILNKKFASSRMRLITHALCSLAYSDIALCKPFLILTMKGLYWVFFAYKTPYSVSIN